MGSEVQITAVPVTLLKIRDYLSTDIIGESRFYFVWIYFVCVSGVKLVRILKKKMNVEDKS